MRRALLLILLAVTATVACYPASADDAATIRRIADRLKQIGASWNDFSCHSEFRFMGAKGDIPMQVKKDVAPLMSITGDAEFRIWCKRPDKVRIEFIHSSIPLISGMIFIQNGTKVGAYDSVSMRTVRSDLTKLLGAQPNHMDTSFGIIDYMMNLSHYDIALRPSKSINGIDCYVLTLKAKKGAAAAMMQEGIAKQDLYVDKKRLTPIREDLYGPGGGVVMKILCQKHKEVKPGVWAPMVLDCRDTSGARVLIHCEWVSGQTLFPTQIEMFMPGADKPTSIARHRDVQVNTGIPLSKFEVKE